MNDPRKMPTHSNIVRTVSTIDTGRFEGREGAQQKFVEARVQAMQETAITWMRTRRWQQQQQEQQEGDASGERRADGVIRYKCRIDDGLKE